MASSEIAALSLFSSLLPDDGASGGGSHGGRERPGGSGAGGSGAKRTIAKVWEAIGLRNGGISVVVVVLLGSVAVVARQRRLGKGGRGPQIFSVEGQSETEPLLGSGGYAGHPGSRMV